MHLVAIGGSDAGISAALRARETRIGHPSRLAAGLWNAADAAAGKPSGALPVRPEARPG
jgi:hypothetical protein